MSSPPESSSSHRLSREQVTGSTSAGPLPTGEFFVVGVAASAGGLDAISELLRRLPLGANLALVIVQHLDPNHESILVDLLNRVTSLPVRWAAHGCAIESGQVYVVPPRANASVDQGILKLHEQRGDKLLANADFFLSSLAEDYKHRAVAVVLSGNGADGTAGAKAVKGMGGIVIVQTPASAAFSSMPHSVIDSGSVDRVLMPAEIADELVKLTKEAPVLWSRIPPVDASPAGTEAEQLMTIFRLLAARTGVDFADYKQSTIKRRLARQMMLAKVSDLPSYVKLLQKNRDEVERLYESLLINVTEFFRDPEYFEFLEHHIVPEILARRRDDVPVRIWVPGCSTGEEVYSISMLIRERLEERGETIPVQIFGTDVSDRAIAHARAGLFSVTDVTNVSVDRLKRFFYKTDRGYVIHKPLRDMCIFARQNVAKDSPFSRLDLISCRNLLIYLSPKSQRKVMSIFHYALNPDGILVLGNSESVGSHVDLYRLIDRRFRIYSRKASNRRTNFEFSIDHQHPGAHSAHRPIPAMSDDHKEPFDIVREADRIVLNRHGPIGVLVNEDLDILQFRGDVSPFLAPVPGRASLNLIKMAREGLAGELQAAMQEAREKNIRVHRRDVMVMPGEASKTINIDVTPIETMLTKERFFLVLFTPPHPEPAEFTAPEVKSSKASGVDAHVEQLRQDLQATRNYLQATIEKHETTNQELRAANEEIQSSNEELQSTNEELETAKEELQSTNEELTTVNEELHSRQLELIQLNNDLNNLINSVHLPIIILGQDMRIRRFTPMAEKVLNVIATDIGRPLTDININLNISNLPQLMTDVVDTLTIKEIEVQDNKGRWYSMRLRPYKTTDQKIEGVVLTLIDIDQMKRTISDLEAARDFAQAVIESISEPLAVLTDDLRIKSVNDAFARFFHTTRQYIQDRPFCDVVVDQDRGQQLRQTLEGIIPSGKGLTDHEIQVDLPGVGTKPLLISACQIVTEGRPYPLISLSLRAAT